MAELKPCPFCGTTPKGQMNIDGVRVYITDDEKRFYVQCDNCGARTAEKITPEKAEVVWNWRTTISVNIYDQEETYPNCTVQVLTNTATGETSVGWWKNGGEEDGT